MSWPLKKSWKLRCRKARRGEGSQLVFSAAGPEFTKITRSILLKWPEQSLFVRYFPVSSATFICNSKRHCPELEHE
jgi:hypothetical protein